MLFVVVRREACNVPGTAVVGETPEKKQNQNEIKLPGSKLTEQKTASELVVEDTMSSSVSAAHNTDSQRTKSDPKLKGDIMKDLQLFLFRRLDI